MFDTENRIFRGKPVITVYKFHPFLEEIGFSKGKENIDTFSLLV